MQRERCTDYVYTRERDHSPETVLDVCLLYAITLVGSLLVIQKRSRGPAAWASKRHDNGTARVDGVVVAK